MPIVFNMEADSTTYEKHARAIVDEPNFPFITCPGNFKLYKELSTDNGDRIFESQIVDRMQKIGLISTLVKCPANTPECKMTCRHARVVDRVQWVCDGCGKRKPIREGSFFFRLQCSILQALQIILAWCEDADVSIAAEHFGVKPKVANHIYTKLDELATKEYNNHQLGGENSVVLAEMYPDCMNRLSPDTTDQPHAHRILMLADTNHIPTYYRLHVIKEDFKKSNITSMTDKMLKSQLEEVISTSVKPGSMIVTGHNMPAVEGASSIQQLTQHCDVGMEHFLSTRIWRQAISLCSASRDICSSASLPTVCAYAVQRYLHAALYRIRFGDGFYQHMLGKLAGEYTESIDESNGSMANTANIADSNVSILTSTA